METLCKYQLKTALACSKVRIIKLRSQIINSYLDEVEHDIMNYQNRGLCYLPKPKAEADNTDTRF